MMPFDLVAEYRGEMVETLCRLIEIKAIAPDFGGEGEVEKAEYVMKKLESFGGFDSIQRFDADDERAKGGTRPNIVAKINGALKKTIWIITHLDVVPEGDERLWQTPPFKGVVMRERVFGRGAEDNGQSIVSSMYAAKVILDSGLTPKYSLGLAFVSDEEAGSNYGVKHLLSQNLFDRDDMFVVPDVGAPNGNLIEIAEKSILWLRFKVYGSQSHGSLPLGLNASRRAMRFILDLDEKLHTKFNARNSIFYPPVSTFEPTKREKNVDNINTIPGLDVSYMDCRILPEYDVDEVIEFIEDVKLFHEMKDKEKIEMEIVQKSVSPPTPENAEIVVKLRKTIESIRGIRTTLYGIGGNTCASFFRREGFMNTVAWCTVDGVAHQPNEYCVIENMVEDAKVFAALPFEVGY
jgi:succinyl-diaminopimelate desuccinylase